MSIQKFNRKISAPGFLNEDGTPFAGSGAALVASGGNNGVATTAARSDHKHADVVAAGASGFMSGADKTKLNGVAVSATAYTDLMAVNAVKAKANIAALVAIADTSTATATDCAVAINAIIAALKA